MNSSFVNHRQHHGDGKLLLFGPAAFNKYNKDELRFIYLFMHWFAYNTEARGERNRTNNNTDNIILSR